MLFFILQILFILSKKAFSILEQLPTAVNSLVAKIFWDCLLADLDDSETL